MSRYTVQVIYNKPLKRWYCSDDGMSWYALHHAITRESTALRVARLRLGY
jgi:hypothetical protein